MFFKSVQNYVPDYNKPFTTEQLIVFPSKMCLNLLQFFVSFCIFALKTEFYRMQQKTSVQKVNDPKHRKSFKKLFDLKQRMKLQLPYESISAFFNFNLSQLLKVFFYFKQKSNVLFQIEISCFISNRNQLFYVEQIQSN